MEGSNLEALLQKERQDLEMFIKWANGQVDWRMGRIALLEELMRGQQKEDDDGGAEDGEVE